MNKLFLLFLMPLITSLAQANEDTLYKLKIEEVERNLIKVSACEAGNLNKCTAVGPKRGVFIPALEKRMVELENHADSKQGTAYVGAFATVGSALVAVASFSSPPTFAMWLGISALNGYLSVGKTEMASELESESETIMSFIETDSSLAGTISEGELISLDAILFETESSHIEMTLRLLDYNKEVAKFRELDSPLSFVKLIEKNCKDYYSTFEILESYKKISEIEAEYDYQRSRYGIKDEITQELLSKCN